MLEACLQSRKPRCKIVSRLYSRELLPIAQSVLGRFASGFLGLNKSQFLEKDVYYSFCCLYSLRLSMRLKVPSIELVF